MADEPKKAPLAEVAGKTAFITGGASGMGLGMAHAFSKAGMKVIIADIRQEALDRAMAGFKNTNLAVHPIQLDITKRDAYARAADEAEKVFGKVHLLCNNAGVGVGGNMKNASYDDWDFCVGVILGGTINGVQTFLPRMLAHGEGSHICSTVSLSGVLATPGLGIYVTAKYAQCGMMEALRHDLAGDNVGVSAYIAGLTMTELGISTAAARALMKGEQPPEPSERMKQMMAQRGNQPRMRGMMDPMEVGEIILRGIRRNDLFIWPTRHYADGIRYRAEALTRGMPFNYVSDELRKRVGGFNDIPVYLNQTQVPPWQEWDEVKDAKEALAAAESKVEYSTKD
jgi:NAD(P)-dependent dehydrogenase (short-subunit alcohol dehydrogenase family)